MKTRVLLSIALSLALICSGTSVWAKVAGPCADCHTMHNSQDGTAVDGAGPSRSLTTGGCVGCHTGTNDGGNIPYVLQTGEPTYVPGQGQTNPTLAGGSFYWVDAGDDTTGHNVVGLGGGTDDNITPTNTPPGWNATTAGEVGIVDDWTASQLTCAGTSGCHGTHDYADDFSDIAGSHHADTGLGADYRFLEGIDGIEDADWEYTSGPDDHNVYDGVARTLATDKSDTATISYFCSTCHGNYHAGAGVVQGDSSIGSNPWLRHPSDYDLNAAQGEYVDYNGDGSSYSVEAPIAADITSASITSAADHDSKINVGSTANTAIVTCISCHRAHGSPYSDLLRWAYNTGSDDMEAGSGAGNKGCFVCHTSKDDV